MMAIFVPPVGATAAGALGAGSVAPAWASAEKPRPDASMQTRANERFMEIRNSFGSWVFSSAFLCGSMVFRSLHFRAEAFHTGCHFLSSPKGRHRQKHGQRTFSGTQANYIEIRGATVKFRKKSHENNCSSRVSALHAETRELDDAADK